ncbi:hypothetical protein AKJ09_06434 [Labilithrix luteola]|uniref:Uncharacterized protein n=1 Tax=Labilithrix luteola TaxID=1391654 RepID=A0A0K1Q1U5_9BACT|nr:hypothetical protein [Labilithrix luteola]AKU99770.1 hypothetical protein AKJ09_06434 [Labilithrix luteola]
MVPAHGCACFTSDLIGFFGRYGSAVRLVLARIDPDLVVAFIVSISRAAARRAARVAGAPVADEG